MFAPFCPAQSLINLDSVYTAYLYLTVCIMYPAETPCTGGELNKIESSSEIVVI